MQENEPQGKNPISPQEFSKKVKEKYPQYKDVDDVLLAQKMIEKYPQYKSQVTFDALKKKEESVSTVPKQKSESVEKSGSLGGTKRDSFTDFTAQPNISKNEYKTFDGKIKTYKQPAPVNKNLEVANKAFDYAKQNVSKEKTLERLNDEIDTNQWDDNLGKVIKTAYNRTVAPALTVANTLLGGNKDFYAKEYVPLEREKKQALEDLEKEKLSDKSVVVNDATITQRAKQLFIEKDTQEQMSQLIDGALPSGYDREGVWKELKLEQLRSNDVLRSAVASAEVYKAQREELDLFVEKLTPEEKKNGLSPQRLSEYNSVLEKAKTANKGLEYLAKNFDNYLQKANSDQEKLELFKYNYNDFEKTTSLLINSTKNIVGGTVKLASEASAYIGNNTNQSLLSAISDVGSEIGSEIMNEADKDNAQFYRYKASSINNWSDLGSLSAQLGAEQIPILASIFLGGTPGTLAVSASSGGQKINELEENAKLPFGRVYSDGEKLLAGLLYAGAEYFPEKFGTARILKDLEKTVSAASTASRKMFTDSFLKTTFKGIGKTALNVGIEGGTELITAEGQITIDQELLGVVRTQAEKNEMRFESAVSGGLMGGGMTMTGGLIGLGVTQSKLYSDKQDIAEVRKIFSNINAINEEIENNPNLTDKERQDLYQETNKLNNEAFAIVEKNAKKGIELPIQAKSFLVDVNQRQADLKAKAKEVSESNFSPEIKKSKIKDLEKQFNSLEEKRNATLNGGYNSLTELSDREVIRLKDLASRELMKEQNPDGTKDVKIEDAEITKRASEIYNKEVREKVKVENQNQTVNQEEQNGIPPMPENFNIVDEATPIITPSEQLQPEVVNETPVVEEDVVENDFNEDDISNFLNDEFVKPNEVQAVAPVVNKPISLQENKDVVEEKKIYQETNYNWRTGKDETTDVEVYHGTGTDFDNYNNESYSGNTRFGKGISFTDLEGIAIKYSIIRQGLEDNAENDSKAIVKKAKLTIKKPFDIRKQIDITTPEAKKLIQILNERYGLSEQFVKNVLGGKMKEGIFAPISTAIFDPKTDEKTVLFAGNTEKTRSIIEEAGYDSIIGEYEDGNEYFVFNPENIVPDAKTPSTNRPTEEVVKRNKSKFKTNFTDQGEKAFTTGAVQIKFKTIQTFDENLDENFFTIFAIDNNGKKIGYAKFILNKDGSLTGNEVEVNEKYQKKGVGTAIYENAQYRGYKINPSVLQTPEGRALWSSLKTENKPTEEVAEPKVNPVTPKSKIQDIFNQDNIKDDLDWLDGLKIDTNNLNSTLPFLPQVFNALIDAIKVARMAGNSLFKAIEIAREQLSDKFNKSDIEDAINAFAEKAGITIQKPKEPTTEKSNDFEKKKGKKSVLNRIYEGENDSELLNEAIEKSGLNYQVQNQEQAQKRAKDFVKSVGVNKALQAVRANQIKGAEKAFVYAEILDQLVELSENVPVDELLKIQTDYQLILDESLNAFDEEARDAGRFISALNKIYSNSKVRYNLTKQIAQYKAVNNGVIDEETLLKFNEADRKIKEVEQKLKEAEAKLEVQEQELAIKNIEEAIAREIKNKVSNRTKANKVANQIRKAKISKPNVFMSATPASLAWDGAVELVAKTIEAGGSIADAVNKGVEFIKNTDWYKNATKDTQKEAVDSFTEQMVKNSIIDNASISISDDGKLKIPESIIKEYVKEGMTDINEISQRIIDDFFEGNEDITVREVRDAITRYGKTINQSKDEIDAKVRELKRLGKLISGMEDVLNGKRPLKSGMQRDKPTQIEREMLRDLKDKMRDLPLDNADLEKAWKNALDTYKQRLANQIEDLEKQIANKEKSKVKRESVKLDEEAKALKEQAKALRETLNELVGKPELTEEQKIARATRQLETIIDNLTNQIANEELGYREKPTPVNSARLTELRKQKDDLSKQLQKAREDAGIVEKRRLKQAKQRLANQIEAYQKRIKEKDFSKKEPKPLPADIEMQKLQAEKIKWQEVYDRAKYEAELKNRKWQDYAREFFVGLVGAPRLLTAGMEMSMVFIQGGIQTVSLATRNPKLLAKIFAKAFISIGSNEKFLEYERAIKSGPSYMLMKNSKLALTESDYQMELREETFIGSNIVYGIWNAIGKGIEFGTFKITGKKEFPTIGGAIISLVKKDIKAKRIPISQQFKNINPLLIFERGNTIYMNELRKARFMDGVKMLQIEGKNEIDNKEDFKTLANAINTLTGRTSIGRLENINDILGVIFFSFKNTISVLQQLNPLFYLYTLRNKTEGEYTPSVAQKLAVKDFVTFVSVTTSMMFLLQAAAGDDEEGKPIIEIEKDPRSSDFMTLKIKGEDKDTRFDPWHGMKPMVVYFARTISGEQKTIKKGKETIKRIGFGYKSETHWDNLMKTYVYNKFSPSMQMVYKQMDSEVDKKDNKTYYGETFEERFNLTPMYIESLKEIEKQDPDELTRFLAALGFFGFNSSTY